MIRVKEIIEQINLELGKPVGKKLNLLFVLDKLEVLGGLETYLYNLACELKKRGHNLSFDCNQISQRMRALFSFVEIYEGLSILEMQEVLKANKIDLLHCQPFESAKRTFLLHQQTEIPFVLSWHGAYYSEDFPKIAQKAEKIMCVSEEVFDLLLEKYPLAAHKLVIVQNALDLTQFTPNLREETTKEITFISRKGVDRIVGMKYLIESFCKSNYGRLNIIGFNEPWVTQDDRVNFVGEVEDVKDYILHADVVVATGRGVREALACGKPCIVLSNWGYDGIVCPANFKRQEYANFSGRGLAEPLDTSTIMNDLNLLMSEDLRASLGRYGRYLAESFYDIARITDKVEIIYQQAVENSQRPKVSIILPVYNHADIIDQCLISLMEQTYRSFELIIVNDGSKDNLTQKIAEYKDSRIRFIDRQENRGLPKTLNEGMRLSLGRYITWTSADNLHRTNYLEELVGVLEREAECGSVYSDYLQIDEEGKFIQAMSKGIYNLDGRVNYGPSFLYRFEAANQVGFFDEELFGTEDRDYSIRMAAAAPVFWLPKVLYEYRIHSRSLTGMYVNKKIDFAPSIKAISNKWKTLLLAPQEEPKELERFNCLYGQKKVLEIIADCTVNTNWNSNLNRDPIFLGQHYSTTYSYFIQPSLQELSEEVRILKATLQFFCIRKDYPAPQKIEVYPILGAWQELTLHAANLPPVGKEIVAKTSVEDVYSWVSFDLTGLVQQWADKTLPNFGVCLKVPEEQGKLIAGLNRHHINKGARPRLLVEYTGRNRCLRC